MWLKVHGDVIKKETTKPAKVGGPVGRVPTVAIAEQTEEECLPMDVDDAKSVGFHGATPSGVRRAAALLSQESVLLPGQQLAKIVLGFFRVRPRIVHAIALLNGLTPQTFVERPPLLLREVPAPVPEHVIEESEYLLEVSCSCVSLFRVGGCAPAGLFPRPGHDHLELPPCLWLAPPHTGKRRWFPHGAALWTVPRSSKVLYRCLTVQTVSHGRVWHTTFLLNMSIRFSIRARRASSTGASLSKLRARGGRYTCHRSWYFSLVM